jgi:hypothetical protein
MRADTFSFKLNGVIHLKNFSSSLEDLFELLNVITKEIGDKSTPISWVIDELDTGSAEVIVRGESPNKDQVFSIINAYGIIGESLQNKKSIPYSARIQEKAIKLTKNVTNTINSIEMTTADHYAQFAEGLDQKYDLYEIVLGAITGTIQTVSSRRKYSFTLFDSIYDKAVKCYFSEDQEQFMRDLWDKYVVIVGKIKRERYTGRPIDIVNIHKIEVINEGILKDFKKAQGIYRWEPGDKKAEDTIREVRDAE